MVGDLDDASVEKVKKCVVEKFSGWEKKNKQIPTGYERGSAKGILTKRITNINFILFFVENAPIQYITIKDKTSCHVTIGQYVGIDR